MNHVKMLTSSSTLAIVQSHDFFAPLLTSYHFEIIFFWRSEIYDGLAGPLAAGYEM